jgi:hypothetical protein
VTEWIVFGFSLASFALIVFYVFYESLYPLIKHEDWRERTLIEYTRRYNREEYDKIRPDLARRQAEAKARANAKIILPSVGNIRKTINGIINK